LNGDSAIHFEFWLTTPGSKGKLIYKAGVFVRGNLKQFTFPIKDSLKILTINIVSSGYKV
jgi:hypothetical protein